MTGIVLGVALLVASTGESPAVETPRATFAPAVFTFDLGDGAAASRGEAGRLLDQDSRPLGRRASLQPAQVPTAKRFSATERIIAVAAGVAVGWVAGAAIGYKLTSKSNSADDVSGLRGVVIGAPIGAAVGAFIGYRLTK
jgi:hypothetical protein